MNALLDEVPFVSTIWWETHGEERRTLCSRKYVFGYLDSTTSRIGDLRIRSLNTGVLSDGEMRDQLMQNTLIVIDDPDQRIIYLFSELQAAFISGTIVSLNRTRVTYTDETSLVESPTLQISDRTISWVDRAMYASLLKKLFVFYFCEVSIDRQMLGNRPRRTI